jgi:hypothetical protein
VKQADQALAMLYTKMYPVARAVKLETVAWQFQREAQSQTCRRQKPG